MGSIALKYGVGLDDLLATNPDIDPHFMTIGKTVIIPIQMDGENQAALPTLTPVPVHVEPAVCYATSTGGTWCYVEVSNLQTLPLENLSAWIGLYGPSGDLLGSEIALAPLNVLLPGMSLPLAAHFPLLVSEGYSIRVELLTALPVVEMDVRYRPVSAQVQKTTLAPDGNRATVRGNIVQPAGSPAAGVIWLAVVAYGVDGKIVGMRKWESDRLTFEINVYSLGPTIERVEVLAEGRP
jgi:hypothetical protein